jgi:hypothetical protein
MIPLSLEQRTDSYIQSFPNFAPLHIFNNRIEGQWIIGNNYSKGTKFYGAYPHKLKERVLALFPDCHNIMHLFSGTINDGTTYDIDAKLNPTIRDDVLHIKNHSDIIEKMDLIMADPPYEKSDFDRYNCKSFNKPHVLRDLASTMKTGAFLTWLDTRVPIYSKESWLVLGHICIIVSTNNRIRCLSIFQKRGKSF